MELKCRFLLQLSKTPRIKINFDISDVFALMELKFLVHQTPSPRSRNFVESTNIKKCLKKFLKELSFKIERKICVYNN